MNKFGIGKRLGACFVFILGLMVATSLYSLSTVDAIKDKRTAASSVTSVKLRHAINFRGSVHDRAIALRDVLLLSDEPAGRAEQIALIDKLAADYAKSEAPLDQMLSDSSISDAVEVEIDERIDAVQAELSPLVPEIISLVENGELESAHELLMTEASPLFTQWLGVINEFIDFQEARNLGVDQSISSAIAQFDQTKTIVLIITIVLAAGASFVVSRSITAPLEALGNSLGDLATGEAKLDPGLLGRKDEIGKFAHATVELQSIIENNMRADTEAREHAARDATAAVTEMSAALKKLASGDLTYRIETAFGADYESLRNDFNEVVDRVSETMKSVVETSTSIHNGTDEVSKASDDLARRTENQAAALEETAAALQEITAGVNAAASGAKTVAQTTAETRGHADNSGAIMRNAVKAMQEIAESSKKISEIISVIDDIAFQTNLLALNAGVEAARAGEAGRGFAVVASEVRALAQRSSEAAGDIKALIMESSQRVDEGVELVGNTGSALDDMLTQIKQVAELVADIANAADEQSTGLAEINSGVSELDRVTQSNAAMVEEVTAATQLLRGDASGLYEMVSFFKLNDRSETAERNDWAA
ncbi:MAG: methyl-accepting chemotaxis protein [Pseudomonadota bacterium]